MPIWIQVRLSERPDYVESKTFLLEELAVVSIFPEIDLETRNVVRIGIREKPNFYPEFIWFHRHILLKTQPTVELNQSFINRDVLTGDISSGKPIFEQINETSYLCQGVACVLLARVHQMQILTDFHETVSLSQ